MFVPWGAERLAGALAQAGGNGLGDNPYTLLGVLVTVVGALVWLCRWAVTVAQARGDRLEKEVLDTNVYLREQAIPTLEAVRSSNAEVAKILAEVVRVLAEVVVMLRDQRGR